MNFNNFTIKSQEAVQEAVNLVKARGQQAIEPVHLLTGVMKVGENVTNFIFQKLGVNGQQIALVVDKQIDSLPKVSGGEPYLSRESNEVLQKATQYSKEMGDEFVSLEHLLLALLTVKSTASTILKDAGMAEKESHMIFELFQALGLPFGLTVANADERNDRGNIHHGQCIRVFCANLAGGCQGAEDAGVVVKNAFHIPLCVKRCQFRRTELLNAHHAAEAADGFVVKRVFKYLPHLFKKRIRSDFRKNRNVSVHILYMYVDFIGIRLILCCRGFHYGVKDCLLAGKMIIQRRRFYADCFCDIAYADGIISFGSKQLQSLIQNFLLGVLLLHNPPH